MIYLRAPRLPCNRCPNHRHTCRIAALCCIRGKGAVVDGMKPAAYVSTCTAPVRLLRAATVYPACAFRCHTHDWVHVPHACIERRRRQMWREVHGSALVNSLAGVRKHPSQRHSCVTAVDGPHRGTQASVIAVLQQKCPVGKFTYAARTSS